MKVKIQDMMHALVKQLNEASEAYYNGKDEIMSDAEYDDKINFLASLEEKYPEWKEEGTPTERVGYGSTLSYLEKVEHPEKMLSLDKRYNIDEICDFFSGSYPILGSLKFDGLTVVLTYENGVLTDCVTRGNGIVGDRITKAARTFKNVPAVIPFRGKLVLRAEAIIGQEMFRHIKEQNPDKDFKNARNLTSGTVRSFDLNMISERNVTAHVFQVISVIPAEGDFLPDGIFDRDSCTRKWVQTLGFECIEYRILYNAEDVREYMEYVREIRATYGYGTDGIVFTVDSMEAKKKAGETAKYPLYSLAFKFPNKGQVSTVRSITWQAGMFSITPVVHIEPIEFDGVTVSRATAHNLLFVMGKDMQGNICRPPLVKGCKVKIERGGEVIPKIADVFYEDAELEDMEELSYPQTCPECGAATEKKGVELVCTNPFCKGKLKAKLRTIVSKNALDISGMGNSAIDLFVDKEVIRSEADILHLEEKKDMLLQFDGFAEKKVNNLFLQIGKSKNAKLPNVISALCIKGVGIEVARILSTIMPNGLIDLLSLDKSRYMSLDGIGEVLAENICSFVLSENGLHFIAELINAGYGAPDQCDTEGTSNCLNGMTICITGTLSVPRAEMEDFIRRNGGKATGSVSKKTTYVLVGEAAGASKLSKALECNVPQVDEAFIRSLVK